MTKSRGIRKHPSRILSKEQRTEIRKLYKDGLTITDLARRFYVSRSTIHRALSEGSSPIKRRLPGPIGANDVPTATIVELREVQGLSYDKIAAKVAMVPSAVQQRYKNYLRGVAR